MNIIIVGAGQVGASLAEHLLCEDNDVTLIDIDSELLQLIQHRLDIRTICGKGSYPRILRDAGAEDADMIIAVSSSDEVNMVVCQVAYSVFNIPVKIARIRSREYLVDGDDLFANADLPIDVCIAPEQLVTDHLVGLITHPGALQVIDFADGLVQLAAIKIDTTGPFLGKSLEQLQTYMPGIEFRVMAIYRQGKPVSLTDSTLIKKNDVIFFVASSIYITSIIVALAQIDHPYQRIMIAGGGNIGLRLANGLEKDYQIKIIERDAARAQFLAEELNAGTVLLGDVTDPDLLAGENIENVDIFCAVTNDDEANIMCSMLAKKMGARKVITLVTRKAYLDMIENNSLIDIAITPQQASVGSILTRIRRGDIVCAHALYHEQAEALEIIAHGDKNTSHIVGKAIKDLVLPKGTSIGAIARGKEVLMPRSDVMIEENDHVILFLCDKSHISAVEKLFQVEATYI